MTGITTTDVIRSMIREGYSRDEVCDVLSGAGLHWQDVQLLLERVELELKGAGFRSRPSQVERAVEAALAETRQELLGKLDSLSQSLELLRFEVKRRPSKK